MDQLELLKSKWQDQEQALPTLSYQDIYKMLLRKSSSIVKWIFLISIAEILFWIVLGFLSSGSSEKLLTDIGLQKTLNVLSIINYIGIVFFIVLFYLNYKNIKITDNVKVLMRNIIKTRKTVKYFVIYNVFCAFLMVVFITVFFYINNEQLYTLLNGQNDTYGAIPLEKFTSIMLITMFVVFVISMAIILLFYRIIYGILLERLKHNYDELERIEM